MTRNLLPTRAFVKAGRDRACAGAEIVPPGRGLSLAIACRHAMKKRPVCGNPRRLTAHVAPPSENFHRAAASGG